MGTYTTLIRQRIAGAQAKITRLEQLLEKMETKGIKEYALNTGQTNQKVVLHTIEDIQRIIEKEINNVKLWENQLRRKKLVRVVP